MRAGRVALRFAWCCLAAACADLIGIHDPQTGTPDAKIDAPADAVATCQASPCDLAPQCGCPAAKSCDDNGNVRYCRADGSGSENSTCTFATDCAHGYTCINTDGQSSCQKLCSKNADCTGPRGECVNQIINGSGSAIPGDVVCTSNCDPLASSHVECPATWACDIGTFGVNGSTYDGVYCRPPGAEAGGSSCAQGSGYCVSGFTCVYFTNGNDLCEHLCSPPSNAGCPGGTTCHAFNTPIVVDGVNYGACW